MPIYEYKCQQCGAHLEVRQSVSDAPLTTCEKCHGRLEKQWSLSGFQFKGAGWYVTDYSRKGSNGQGSADKNASADSTGAADAASNSTSLGDKPSGTSETKVAT